MKGFPSVVGLHNPGAVGNLGIEGRPVARPDEDQGGRILVPGKNFSRTI